MNVAFTRLVIHVLPLLLALAWSDVAAFSDRPESAVLKVEDLLPRDGAVVDVMELVFPDRQKESAKQIQQTVQKDPDWFLSHIKKAKPGEPLPYDPRLGVTKREYEEFLKLAEEVTLKKVRTAKLSVARNGNRIALDGGRALPHLKSVELDLDADSVATPFGDARVRETIKASEGQKATGPLNGLAWRLETLEENPLNGTVVKFSLGRLEKTDRGILYYDVKQVDPGSKTRITYILLFDLKPPK